MNGMKPFFLLFGMMLLLTSCSTGTPELSGLSPQAQAEAIKHYGGIYKVGNPYKIGSQWYYPKEDYSYVEEGMASWYGEDFNGKMTANGERYNMNTLTAAHRTLPLPSIVKVTNLQNGRSIVVRVNDRGPYVKNRIIDLSKHGAQLLGYMGQGTTRVRVEVMAKESKALKLAMLNEPAEQKEKAYAAAAQSVPAHSLYETNDERKKVSQQEEEKLAVYAQAGDKTYQSGTLPLQLNIPEQAAYGSAASADGTQKSGALGVIGSPEPIARTASSHSADTYHYMNGYYYIHAGSFRQYDLAHKLMVRLKEYGESHISNVDVGGTSYYRVSVGPYNYVEEAKVAQAKLKYYGINDTRIEKK